MIKAIIFDLGGVVIENPDRSILKRIDDIRIVDEFKRYRYNLLIGKINASKLEKIFMKKFNKKINLKKILEREMSKAKVNYEVKRLILKLKKKYKIMFISNTVKEHVKVCKEKGLFNFFSYGIVSCNVGIAKPDPRIFKLALRKLKVKPEECLFIDDEERNIIGAIRLKINAILFRNNKQLINDLKRINIQI